MGGEAFQAMADEIQAAGRSPRGRRSRELDQRINDRGGSISAWAEKPSRQIRTEPQCRVDLRVGGEAVKSAVRRRRTPGRSPRGRRSQDGDTIRFFKQGSISAWAEKPRRRRIAWRRLRVDLRVGGEAPNPVTMPSCDTGRSPRGRRSRERIASWSRGVGSISAWAEKPRDRVCDPVGSGVDLRVGGEANPSASRNMQSWGRSPRGRRSLANPLLKAGQGGSISAWAEKPTAAPSTVNAVRVDLRVGGEASIQKDRGESLMGRSPRGRRSLRVACCSHRAVGSISAWAEKPASA